MSDYIGQQKAIEEYDFEIRLLTEEEQRQMEEMSDLKPCPFCGSDDIYETYSQEWKYGTKNPEIFCNSCKAIFAIEDDSPFMNCEEDYKYRKEKTKEAWNRRKGEQE